MCVPVCALLFSPVSEFWAQGEVVSKEVLLRRDGSLQPEERMVLHTGLPQVFADPVVHHVETQQCVPGLPLFTGRRGQVKTHSHHEQGPKSKDVISKWVFLNFHQHQLSDERNPCCKCLPQVLKSVHSFEYLTLLILEDTLSKMSKSGSWYTPELSEHFYLAETGVNTILVISSTINTLKHQSAP